MKKIVAVIFLSILILFSGCGNNGESQNNKKPNDNNVGGINGGSVNVKDEVLDKLSSVVGLEFFEGKTIIKDLDQEILGSMCEVFKVGVSTEDKFTAENFLALSESGEVFEYDVALDLWSKYGELDSPLSEDEVNIVSACLYVLNDIFIEEYTTGAMNDSDYKLAVYENENAFNSGNPPVLLYGVDEEVPDGYFLDPAVISYYEVDYFKSLSDLYSNLSIFLSDAYLSSIKPDIESSFFEYDGALYIKRGGMGYGNTRLNLDDVDYSSIKGSSLVVEALLNEVPDGKYNVRFANDNGAWKIDSCTRVE